MSNNVVYSTNIPDRLRNLYYDYVNTARALKRQRTVAFLRFAAACEAVGRDHFEVADKIR